MNSWSGIDSDDNSAAGRSSREFLAGYRHLFRLPCEGRADCPTRKSGGFWRWLVVTWPIAGWRRKTTDCTEDTDDRSLVWNIRDTQAEQSDDL